MFRMVSYLLGIAVIALAGYLAFWPVPIEPQAFETPPNPGLAGVYAPNDILTNAERIGQGLMHGPEDTAMDEGGLLYTGFEDGRIVRFDPDNVAATLEEFANTGGRPLGLEFHPDGYLVVADAFKGILAVDPDGTIRTLTDTVNGEYMIFVDDLSIARDGTIWFSDASQRWDLVDNLLDFYERHPTGRLLTYDPGTDETIVQLEGLYFANGVALGPNEDYVLVNETMAYRISRLWLKGPRAGEHDYFVEALPGMPDNLSYDGRDTVWVAFAVPRNDAAEIGNSSPFLRKMFYRIVTALNISPVVMHGITVGFDTNGNVTHNLQSASGQVGMTTSINQHADGLYVGGLISDFVVRLQPDEVE
ncbi:SMP-30/gluconolactonase/LRE family protein [bacterium AH-315-P15]|nr:SMP-30/gluconolactonase/LRE family protein [bacterium AH-315-P15]